MGLAGHQSVFLRPEVKVEPLVCGWYAWVHLISPVQHALNITYRHLPLLQSFEKNPDVHFAASSDPSLFGGPFVDLPPEAVPEVQRLIEQTQQRCSRLIQLAQDLKRLDRSLQESAKGYSLDELYSAIPESLSGLVEFLYDINNHPRLRFHEALVYDEYLDSSAQQISLSLTQEEKRPFFMTTPRVDSPECVVLPIPFADSRVDRLASLRTQPAPLAEIAETLGVPAARRATLDKMFTTEPPPKASSKPHGDEISVRYFGHACVLMQSATTSVLVDPMFCVETEKADGRLTLYDLPEHIDYVVLSHSHHDHCSPEILLQLRHRIGRIVVPGNNSGSVSDPSLRLALSRIGFESVIALDEFDSIDFDGGRITSLPFQGEHCDLDIYSRQGIHVSMGERRFAFFVDASGMDIMLFRRIARRLGKRLDILFIGMECRGGPLSWLYGPLFTSAISRKNDESRRLSGLDSARAWKVVQEFEAANVFVYAMGQEPWLRFIMGLEYTSESYQKKEVSAFLDQCARSQLRAECLFMSRELDFRA
jgi:L-ascorbate metabolism protein UlaG (beta-lactamase superfamily)